MIAAASLATFLYVESHVESPVLSLPLFKSRRFTIPIVSLVLSFSGQAAVTFEAGSRANVLRGGTWNSPTVTNDSIYSQKYDGPTFSSGVVLTDAVTAGDERRIFRADTATYGAV